MKHKYIFLVVAFSIYSWSCSDLLTEENKSGFTSETVYTDPQGFESLVSATYSYLRAWYGKEEGYNLMEMGTDLWFQGVDNRRVDIMAYNNMQANEAGLGETERFFQILWRRSYQAINLINTGLEFLPKSGLTPAVQAVREGELKFLRAHFYWLLTEQWGDVHFTTQVLKTAETTANRTPRDKIYEAIISDLNLAVTNLPNTTTQYGRVTKPAAEAFLARIYLTLGRNREASDLAQKVISGYAFKLVPRFADLWNMNNLKNSEVIWACNYTTDLTLSDLRNTTTNPDGHPRGGNNGHLLYGMTYERTAVGAIGMQRDILNGRPFARYMPTSHLLDLYNENIDSRYNGTFKTVWICNRAGNYTKRVGTKTINVSLKLGDTAIVASKYDIPDAVDEAKTYLFVDRPKMYKDDGTFNGNAMFVPLSKFDDPTRPTFNEAQSGRDVFIIRLAEMYLIAAEAEMKLNNNTKAAELINVIRERAAVTGRTADMRVLPAAINIDFILDERARELAGEQLRWFDLKRTGKLIERVKKFNPVAAPFIQNFHTVRPIPQVQIDAVTNKEEFKQNPGYN